MSLENSFTVPKLKKVDRIGRCVLTYSTELLTIEYEGIKDRFISSGKLK